MKFARVKWEGRISPFTVARVTFTQSEIENARQIADAKVEHINALAPNAVRRDQPTIHSRIVAGKLADYGVRTLISGVASKYGLPVSIEEYDDLRTDDFRSFDLFDLLIAGPLRRSTVEIRSSFAYRLRPVGRMISKLSVYGWYTSRGKLREQHKDLYWQVLYYARPQNIEPPVEQEWPIVPIFESTLEAFTTQAYIIGGCTKALLSDEDYADERLDDQRGARYRAVYPATRAFDVERMLRATFRSIDVQWPPLPADDQ